MKTYIQTAQNGFPLWRTFTPVLNKISRAWYLKKMASNYDVHSYADDSPFSHSPCIERLKHLLVWFLCFIETSMNNLMSQKYVCIIFYRSRFVLKIENLVSRTLIGSNQNISSVNICCLSTIKHRLRIKINVIQLAFDTLVSWIYNNLLLKRVGPVRGTSRPWGHTSQIWTR